MRQLGNFGGNNLGVRSRDSIATELSPATAMFGLKLPQSIAVPVRSNKPVTMRNVKARQRRSWLAPPSPPRPSLPSSPPEARLLYVSPLGGSTNFVLSNKLTRIGRKEDNDIVLSDAKISKRHCIITLTSRQEAAENDIDFPNENSAYAFVIKDNNSSNGVRLNEVYISQPTPMKNGDRIQLGSIVLNYEELDPINEGSVSAVSSSVFHSPSLENMPFKNLPTASDVFNNLDKNSNRSGPERIRIEEANKGNSPYSMKSLKKSLVSSPVSTHSNPKHDSLKGLVTILSSEKKEETVSIRAELDEPTDNDFPPVEDIKDIDTLKQDYEKLRLAYELSKFSSVTSDVNEHLTRMLDIMFSVLPVDRGVVLLVDNATALLVTNMVRVREGKGYEDREIMLSSTILQRVYNTRKCLITSDACEDPDLGKSFSIARGQIRSVICVPILAHDEVLGILHLDSRDRINAFIEKDLALVQTVINQTAVQIENSIMFTQKQTEIRVSEQLRRFLPPQVVDRMVKKEEVIHKGGREITGTIVFADIRGFTNLSERSTPAEVFDLLNDYFERLVNVVFKFNGVVDKFIGDELMAIFGTLDDASADVTPSVLNSVLAALEFKKAVKEMNEDRAKVNKEPIKIGIGLNTGHLMAGFMGSSERLEYTCIGDTVNLASRICGGAAAGQVLISDGTLRYVKGRIETKYVGSRQFKGKKEETRLYEAIGIREDEDVSFNSIDSLA